MEKQLFGKDSPQKRQSKLEGFADSVEEMTYMRNLDPREVAFFKDEFSQLSIDISRKKDELKKITDTKKAEMKPLEVRRNDALQNIKLGGVEVTGRVFKVVNQEEQKTGYYDSMGVLIKERPMTDDERQLTIASGSRRTGTDD